MRLFTHFREEDQPTDVVRLAREAAAVQSRPGETQVRLVINYRGEPPAHVTVLDQPGTRGDLVAIGQWRVRRGDARSFELHLVAPSGPEMQRRIV